MLCSFVYVVPSKCLLLRIEKSSSRVILWAVREWFQYENKHGYRMVEQLFNSVFAKYRDLSVSRWLIGSPLTNICQYFAQPRSRRKARENLCKRVTINIGLVFSSDWVRKWHELFRSHSNGVVMQTKANTNYFRYSSENQSIWKLLQLLFYRLFRASW